MDKNYTKSNPIQHYLTQFSNEANVLQSTMFIDIGQTYAGYKFEQSLTGQYRFNKYVLIKSLNLINHFIL